MASLYAKNSNFVNECKCAKDVISLFRLKHVPRVVLRYPERDWVPFWKLVNHSILCNTLKLFSWKIAHGALYTQEKLSRWGVSDGKRPFCLKFETLVHVFWGVSINLQSYLLCIGGGKGNAGWACFI